MTEPHDHAAHGTTGHGQAMLHVPATDAAGAYRRDYESARPDDGRRVIVIDLEAREADWSVAPGATFRAWTFNGQIPGPTIEGRTGDAACAFWLSSLDARLSTDTIRFCGLMSRWTMPCS